MISSWEGKGWLESVPEEIANNVQGSLAEVNLQWTTKITQRGVCSIASNLTYFAIDQKSEKKKRKKKRRNKIQRNHGKKMLRLEFKCRVPFPKFHRWNVIRKKQYFISVLYNTQVLHFTTISSYDYRGKHPACARITLCFQILFNRSKRKIYLKKKSIDRKYPCQSFQLSD